MDCISQPHLTRRTGESTWKPHKQAVVQPKRQADRDDSLQRKPVALFSQGTWDVSWLGIRQQRKSFAGLKTASPAVPGQGK